MIGLATVLLVAAMCAVWANRLLFDPGNWSHSSTELLENQSVRTATAKYLVDRLDARGNLESRVRSRLPLALQGWATPTPSAWRNAAVQETEFAMSSPLIRDLWAQANRSADQAFIAVVDGGKGAAQVKPGVVALNLGPILDNVAVRLALPSKVRTRLSARAARLTILTPTQLRLVQDGGKAIQGLALWLAMLVPVLYGLAVLLTPSRRRRTLMTIGVAGVVAGLLVLFGREILQTRIANALTEVASLRPAIRATIAIGTGMLSELARGVILASGAVAVGGWIAGVARVATVSRQTSARWARAATRSKTTDVASDSRPAMRPERLKQLAELRGPGEVASDEYQTASG